jgi:hypothetical protein
MSTMAGPLSEKELQRGNLACLKSNGCKIVEIETTTMAHGGATSVGLLWDRLCKWL